MLAAIYDFLPVELQLHALEFDADEDAPSIFYIATEQAIASANVLLVQLKELLFAHGQDLHKVLPDPFKSLLQHCMPDLEEFAAVHEVPYGIRGKIVEQSSGLKRKWFPKPVTAIRNGRLARLALLAGARPTNNNSIESRWSLLTNRYHAMVRKAGAQYMSAIFRKADFANSYLRPFMETEEFERIFAECRKFMRDHKGSYRAIFCNNQEESERKLRAETKPLGYYAESNIGALANKEDSHDMPNEKKLKKKPVKRGKPMTRYEGSESEHHDSFESESEGDGSDSSSSSVGDDDGSASVTAEPVTHESDSYEDNGLDSDVYGPNCGPLSGGEHQCSSRISEGGSCNGGALTGIAVNTDDERSQQSPQRLKSSANSNILELKQASIEENDAPVNSDPDFKLAPSSQSRDDAAPQKSSEQNADSSDEATDLPTGFFEDPDEQDDEAGPENIDHPFPNPTVLSDEDAKKASRWKLDYIWHLLKNNKWKDTVVTANTSPKNPVLTLTRLDGETFPLTKCANLFYVFYGDNGLEVMHVESITFKVLDSEKTDELRNLMKRKQPEEQWCVTYSRCLRTEKAVHECTKRDYAPSNDKGVTRPTSLGSNSLNKLLRQKDPRLIFHKGDVPYETAAKYIVGFVGWDSAASSNKDSDFRDVLKSINANLRGKTSLLIDKTTSLDWVYCGPTSLSAN